jgi:hypothetical protein
MRAAALRTEPTVLAHDLAAADVGCAKAGTAPIGWLDGDEPNANVDEDNDDDDDEDDDGLAGATAAALADADAAGVDAEPNENTEAATGGSAPDELDVVG